MPFEQPAEAFWLPQPIWAEMLAHVRLALPHEGCGLLGGTGGRAVQFYPTLNVHSTPLTRYSIDPLQLLRVFKAMEQAGQELVAIFHSHPTSAAYPSVTDISQAYYPDALSLIVSLKDAENPVLRGFWLRDGVVAEHPVRIGAG